MNNRVFKNSIRVVKDMNFPMDELLHLINDFQAGFQALVQLTTGTDRQSRVESNVKTNSLDFCCHPNLDVIKACMRGCNFT